jgi:short-subunit dehydrogenase
MGAFTLSNRVAVISGATSGIGRAIAIQLAAKHAILYLVGRDAHKLQSLERELAPTTAEVHTLSCELDRDENILALRPHIERLHSRVDILVHSAGAITLAPIEAVSMADFDYQYRINVRAPVLLTQSLLPLIKDAKGQIVFINSSVGVRTKELVGAYAASKHALKAIADTLRMEVNASGVRVMSVFPGNTATPMQQKICSDAGSTFRPDNMLRAEDVASAVVDALLLAPSAELTDIHIRPSQISPA